ncbi:MAG: shikimate kinase [Methanosphaera sp.]|uniref:shikimate kinase n=1 Tax=Methanosphaera sp. TaxID=2666342 RepID=UPI002E76E22D|nr:shikimate kinase [Methanosphaera sp.]MEE1117638.1 shikimate kinase [Methanosphaera sp.]MEE3324694.1 shikimate kinase [Methanosphaera sp.]MEE3418662.1 shikimate kinase [Methanosphaera sp.]
MVCVRSPASATVINAISTGKGSAFGIELYVTANVTILPEKTAKDIESVCKSLDKPDMDTTLMHLCVKKVYEKLIEYPDFNLKNVVVNVETKSDIPPGSGLSSSSAASNSVVYATLLTLLEAEGMSLEDTDITDEDIINMGIDASLECGVTKTGSYDDASASYYGGWKITDNYERKILYDYLVNYHKILIYIPNKSLYTAQSDVKAMKTLSSLVEIAFDNAVNKNIEKALTLNGLLYCAALDLDTQIAIDALKLGAKAAGLSGTGSAYTILLDDTSDVNEIKEKLSKYPGKLIETKPDNTGSVVIS